MSSSGYIGLSVNCTKPKVMSKGQACTVYCHLFLSIMQLAMVRGVHNQILHVSPGEIWAVIEIGKHVDFF